MTLPRIRQLVFASRDIEDIARLKQILDLGEGFVDPGVKVFGLTNGVFALGDQFLEVVVPIEENTAAGRFMDRSHGQGGYMVIFQTEDLARVRAFADQNQIRRVWDIDVDDISASHLHPADIGAAIVSVDEARPAGSWRWGGPNWEAEAKPGALTVLDLIARDPETFSTRWATMLGVAPANVGHGVWDIQLSSGRIRVQSGDRDYVSGYTLAHPDPAGCLSRAAKLGLTVEGTCFDFAGVKVSLTAN